MWQKSHSMFSPSRPCIIVVDLCVTALRDNTITLSCPRCTVSESGSTRGWQEYAYYPLITTWAIYILYGRPLGMFMHNRQWWLRPAAMHVCIQIDASEPTTLGTGSHSLLLSWGSHRKFIIDQAGGPSYRMGQRACTSHYWMTYVTCAYQFDHLVTCQAIVRCKSQITIYNDMYKSLRSARCTCQ